ncbi:hypothetical protein B5F23_02355 [Olsenella sp. An188]|nr:hypothetical protein B5F23_02355 [Olsenella sp. An188]
MKEGFTEMNRKTRRSIAVVAGLTAVLALSPVTGALTTAHADETAPEAVSTQSVEGVDPQSFSAEKWSWWTKEWHLGNWWPWGVWHPEVDFFWPDGRCDLCLAPIKDDCKPGGDDKPEQQQEVLTVVFVFADGTEKSVEIETPVGEQVAFSEFVEKLGEAGNGITWYWAAYDGAPEVDAENLLGGDGHHLVHVYEHKADDPVPETHKVTFDDQVDGTENSVVVVEDGETVAEPTEPTCDGYTFEGWYTEPECVNAYDFDTPVTQDITLYAKWVEDEEPTDPTDPTDPGTDPEEPGTDTENPGDGSGDQGGNTDQGDTTNPGDNTTDQGNDTTKPAGDATSTDDGSNDDDADEDAIPNTGDATVAVSGIAALGTAVAGLGVFLRRRS